MLCRSHGDGILDVNKIKTLGENVIFERDVRVFHPENLEIGNHVYVGNDTYLKGYYNNHMKIGSHTWIGQMCFFHSGGGIEIGNHVGIGPCVKILTLQHVLDDNLDTPIIEREQTYEKVVIEDNVDIGVGSIILPSVRIGTGSVIGAGSVVTKDVEPYSIVVGNPAKLLRMRK